MKYCSNCGSPMEDGSKFCTACGAPADPANKAAAPGREEQMYEEAPVHGPDRDVQENRIWAVLAYLGVLVLVPLLVAKDSPFARFHTNQGLVLLIASAVVTVLSKLAFFAGLLSLPLFVFAIMGIINALRGQEKELPLIGHFRLL